MITNCQGYFFSSSFLRQDCLSLYRSRLTGFFGFLDFLDFFFPFSFFLSSLFFLFFGSKYFTRNSFCLLLLSFTGAVPLQISHSIFFLFILLTSLKSYFLLERQCLEAYREKKLRWFYISSSLISSAVNSVLFWHFLVNAFRYLFSLNLVLPHNKRHVWVFSYLEAWKILQQTR